VKLIGHLLAGLLLCELCQQPGGAQQETLCADPPPEYLKDPQLFLWKTLKRALTDPSYGPDYFNSSMKGAMVPQLKGKVVKLEPEVAPKTIVLAIEDGKTPDATLKFDVRLPGKVPIGTELSFEGLPESYTASPFMVVFGVEREHLHGWPKPKR